MTSDMFSIDKKGNFSTRKRKTRTFYENYDEPEIPQEGSEYHRHFKSEDNYRKYNSPQKRREYNSHRQFQSEDNGYRKKTKHFHRDSSYDDSTEGGRNDGHTNNRTEDKKLTELVSYYEKILQSVKGGLPEEGDFVNTVLQESQGYEIELSAHKLSSHCIELLLSLTDDPAIIHQFMAAFALEKFKVFTTPTTSHLTELLLKNALHGLQNWSTIIEMEDDSEEKKNTLYYITWISELGEFVMENFVTCLENRYACHVTSSLIQALGGNMSDVSDHSSKRSVKHKKDFRENFVGEEVFKKEKKLVLDTVPKFFTKVLKKLTKTLLKIENIEHYVTESSSATVIQVLIRVSQKHVPKRCRKLIKGLAEKIFLAKTNEGVPRALTDQTCSYVVEILFEASDEELQQNLWNQYLDECVEALVTDSVGNFIVQRLLDAVKSKTLCELICEKIETLFDKVLWSRRYGIFNAVAGACNRLKVHQGQFMKSFMQCLHCNDPEDRQIQIVPLTLGFQLFDQPKAQLCLQGSLLVQTMLKFQKPIRVVNSILQMKPQELGYLACHMQGCHVLNSFFSSSSVGEKSKDKLIQCMKPSIKDVACDRNGSLTLSRIWTLLSLKQRSSLANLLIQEEAALQANQNGNILVKKFGLYYFRKHIERWREIQKNIIPPKHKR